jgi:hypothetical protein
MCIIEPIMPPIVVPNIPKNKPNIPNLTKIFHIHTSSKYMKKVRKYDFKSLFLN